MVVSIMDFKPRITLLQETEAGYRMRERLNLQIQTPR